MNPAQSSQPNIVERLRRGETSGVVIPCDDLKEAADEIERLTERCSAYKGQVEAGAAEIAALKARVAELEAALPPAMSEQLVKFLELVPQANWRRNMPTVWNEQLRQALSEGLVAIGFGGVFVLTDAGRAALQKDNSHG